MDAIKAFLVKFFADRVYGHLSSTIAGAIASVALALATYTQALQVPAPWNYVAYVVSFVLFALGAAYKGANPPAPAP